MTLYFRYHQRRVFRALPPRLRHRPPSSPRPSGCNDRHRPPFCALPPRRFDAACGCPVKVINDAAMQALGSYEGGRMLFLGLGTGLGNTLILDGTIAPLELGHLPYKKGRSFEQYVGLGGLQRLGKRKWRKAV